MDALIFTYMLYSDFSVIIFLIEWTLWEYIQFKKVKFKAYPVWISGKQISELKDLLVFILTFYLWRNLHLGCQVKSINEQINTSATSGDNYLGTTDNIYNFVCYKFSQMEEKIKFTWSKNWLRLINWIIIYELLLLFSVTFNSFLLIFLSIYELTNITQ